MFSVVDECGSSGSGSDVHGHKDVGMLMVVVLMIVTVMLKFWFKSNSDLTTIFG